MPYNRTRTWVGIAVIAVTIPAVGTFYNSSRSQSLRGTPVAVADHADLTSRPKDSFGSGRISIHPAARDYDAEVGAALARQNAKADEVPLPGSEDDPTFDLEPIALPDDEAPLASASPIVETPTDTPSVEAPPTVAETRDLVANDVAANDDGAVPRMSDRTVYALVVNNLPQDQREEFVRAYALMTPDQRADLLDDFRAQMESGNPSPQN